MRRWKTAEMIPLLLLRAKSTASIDANEHRIRASETNVRNKPAAHDHEVLEYWFFIKDHAHVFSSSSENWQTTFDVRHLQQKVKRITIRMRGLRKQPMATQDYDDINCYSHTPLHEHVQQCSLLVCRPRTCCTTLLTTCSCSGVWLLAPSFKLVYIQQ